MSFLRDFPRLTLVCLSIVAAYVLSVTGGLSWLHNASAGSELLAMVVGGMLFSTGFTAPFGIAVFVEIGNVFHPLLGALLGGMGALLTDLLIFEVMRLESFRGELERLKVTRVMQWIRKMIHHKQFPEKLRTYLLWSFAGIVIASPLPDEIGVMMVSALGSMHPTRFAVVCYIANTIGILLILLGARVLV